MNYFLKSLLLGEGNQVLINKGDFFTDKMVANANYGNWRAFWQEVELRRKGGLYNFNQVEEVFELYLQNDSALKEIANKNKKIFFKNFLNDLKTADFETEFFLRPLFENEQLKNDFKNYFYLKLTPTLKDLSEEEINQEFFDFENKLLKITNQKRKDIVKRKYLEVVALIVSSRGSRFDGLNLDGPDFFFNQFSYLINEQLSFFNNKEDHLREHFRIKFLNKLFLKSDLPGGIDSLVFLESYQETLTELGKEFFQGINSKKEAIDLLNSFAFKKEATGLKNDLIKKITDLDLDIQDLFMQLNSGLTNPNLDLSKDGLRDIKASEAVILKIAKNSR